MNKKHKNNNNEILNQITGNRIEAYLLPQINSLKIRKIIKKYRPNKISQEYKFWVQSIINECKNKKYNCFFVDQPTGYKKKCIQ